MPVLPAANASSVGESSTKFVFPIEEGIRSKIPVWMKFYCYEYTNTVAGRALSYSRAAGGANVYGLGTKEKAQILIPAPVNFQTSTAHNYVQESRPNIEFFPTGALTLLKNALPASIQPSLQAILDGIADFQYNASDIMDQIDTIVGGVAGFSSEIPADHSDTMYIGSGASRTFEIRVNMPCLTERDSKSAGAIIRAFEALSLPTARSLFSTTTTKFFHPPLWIFGIGPADSLKFDPDWTGYPQLSVLRTVTHKKTAFETNSLAAIGYNGLFKPVAYSLTLVFQELEPAFRVTNPLGQVGTQITNRSGVLTSTGTTIAAKIIPG